MIRSTQATGMPRGQRPTAAGGLVLVVGVLLRGPAILVRVGLLGFRLERAIRPNVPLAYWALHVPLALPPSIRSTAHVPSSAPAERRRWFDPLVRGAGRNLQRSSSRDRGVDVPQYGSAYLTRFWVHSRSRFVSRAVLSPSLKLVRTPFSRRCARACSSRSSCCFAFNWPELIRVH